MLTLSPSKIALLIHSLVVLLLVWTLLDFGLLNRAVGVSSIVYVMVSVAVTILAIFSAKSFLFLAVYPRGELHFFTSVVGSATLVWQPQNFPPRVIELLSVNGRGDWLLCLRYQEVENGKTAELVMFTDSASASERRALRKFLLAIPT